MALGDRVGKQIKDISPGAGFEFLVYHESEVYYLDETKDQHYQLHPLYVARHRGVRKGRASNRNILTAGGRKD